MRRTMWIWNLHFKAWVDSHIYFVLYLLFTLLGSLPTVARILMACHWPIIPTFIIDDKR